MGTVTEISEVKVAILIRDIKQWALKYYEMGKIFRMNKSEREIYRNRVTAGMGTLSMDTMDFVDANGRLMRINVVRTSKLEWDEVRLAEVITLKGLDSGKFFKEVIDPAAVMEALEGGQLTLDDLTGTFTDRPSFSLRVQEIKETSSDEDNAPDDLNEVD